MQLRAMHPSEMSQVAALIHLSTNSWYQRAGKGLIFQHGPESCRLFCDVYEDLDPGCCVVAVDESTGQIIGSCFYHPRETHGSLGMSDDTPLAGMWRFSRMLRIADGPDEVHKMVIARRELNRWAKRDSDASSNGASEAAAAPVAAAPTT